MPELPEVETVVRDLRPLLIGRRIRALHVGPRSLRKPWSAEWNSLLVGRSIVGADRRGKWIVFRLDSAAALVIHLGMTGQLRVHPAKEPCADHTHLIFDLDDKDATQLRFRDVRRFGSATFYPGLLSLEAFFEKAGLGPEPWDLAAAEWRERLRSTGRCLKAVLLDQRVVAGVGNIYADESLFQARLHPAQLGKDTSARQATRLREAIVAVLERAIHQRGSSIRDYIGGSGLKGEFQNEFSVYGRTASPCVRCRKPIERVRLAGRSTHYCPRCQKR